MTEDGAEPTARRRRADDADRARRAARGGARMSTVAARRASRARAHKRPGVGTVYRWELRKLRAQKRTYLGLGAAALVPLIFVVALLSSSGGPDEVPFGRYVRETGLAVPLVGLLFSSVWLFPLITSLVAGDIVVLGGQPRHAEDDPHPLDRALADLRRQAARGAELRVRRARRLRRRSGSLLGGTFWGFDPLTSLSGTQIPAGPRDAADRRVRAGVLHPADRDRRRSRSCCRPSRTTRRPPSWGR